MLNNVNNKVDTIIMWSYWWFPSHFSGDIDTALIVVSVVTAMHPETEGQTTDLGLTIFVN